MGELAILTKDGDLKVIWDSGNDDEVEAARAQFDKLTKEKKYVAFSVKKDGEKGTLAKKFDPEAEKLILCPPVVGG